MQCNPLPLPNPAPRSTATRVGLVFGGRSGEHDVSIRSARAIAHALSTGDNRQRHQVVLHYVTRGGRWLVGDGAAAALSGAIPPESDRHLPRLPTTAHQVDVWFPVLHGPNGEDGTVQGLFTLLDQPFVGTGVLGAAVGMDKQAMKAAFATAGLPQAAYVCATANELARPDELVNTVEHRLGYPCFVKPANLGSSLGVSKAGDREGLLAGLQSAARLDDRLVVEAAVPGRELECAVLGYGHLDASVVGEILYDTEWYDYTSKYSPGRSSLVIPASIPQAIHDRIRRLAVRATQAVGAYGLSRVDFFYQEDGQNLYVNEINTMPGFTSQSMYPLLWQASGVSVEELVHRLIELAQERHQGSPSSRSTNRPIQSTELSC